MKRLAIIATHWRNSILGAAMAISAGWLALILPDVLGLRALSYDLPFALRPAVRPAEAIIVYMDEESRGRLKQSPLGPWDRSLHLRLLQELTRRGARLIVFDILMDEPSADPSLDQNLAEAMRAHGNVVLAASHQVITSEGRPPVAKLLRPVDPLGTMAAWGVVEMRIELDNTIRRHYYHPTHTNLSWQAAAAFGRTPSDRGKTRWLSFYGPSGAIPHFSYYQVLEDRALPAGAFKGKAVFIGEAPTITYQGARAVDDHRTPFTRWTGKQSAGVEVQTTAFLNLVRPDWIEELSPMAELGWIALVGMASAWFWRFKPLTGVGVALALFVATGTLACFSMWRLHIWFPWLITGLVQMPVAVGWSALMYLQRLDRGQVATPIPALAQPVAQYASRKGPIDPESLPPTMQMAGAVGPDRTKTTHDLEPTVLAQERYSSVPSIPDHQLIRVIGKGAYGEVWLARDVIGGFHALKIVYRNRFSVDAPFLREFRGIQKFTPISLSHPGLVHVLHVGRNERGGYFYYVMEIGDDELAGRSIDPESYSVKNLAKEIARRGSLPVVECIDLGLSLASALDFLHQKQLIHRDIKPSNIIYVENRPKFADVGLVTEMATPGTESSYVGTEGFIPPEGPGAAAADIYSLGKVLYEASMGRDRQRYPELPTSVAERSDHSSLVHLNQVILKACAAKVAERFGSAAELREELLRVKSKIG